MRHEFETVVVVEELDAVTGKDLSHLVEHGRRLAGSGFIELPLVRNPTHADVRNTKFLGLPYHRLRVPFHEPVIHDRRHGL